jgi:hypothetical protein
MTDSFAANKKYSLDKAISALRIFILVSKCITPLSNDTIRKLIKKCLKAIIKLIRYFKFLTSCN